MSLSVMNKTFLSLLHQLSIDIDTFSDKSFDSLFEGTSNNLNYFLEWFVENIDDGNVLAPLEKDIYEEIKAADKCLENKELDAALEKCSVTYETLEAMSDTRFGRTLVEEFKDLSEQVNKFTRIADELECLQNELHEKLNHQKEDSCKSKRTLSSLLNQCSLINLNMKNSREYLTSLKIVDDLTTVCDKVSSSEDWIEKTEMLSHSQDSSMSLMTESFIASHLNELKSNLDTSKYVSLILQSILEKKKYEISKAEEFLTHLRFESENNFTFDEALSNFSAINDSQSLNNLKLEIGKFEHFDLEESLRLKSSCQISEFVSEDLLVKLDQIELKIQNVIEYIDKIKTDLCVNLVLKSVCNKMVQCMKDHDDCLNSLQNKLKKDQYATSNAQNVLSQKNHVFKDFNEIIEKKHALVSCVQKMDSTAARDGQIHCLKRSMDLAKVLFDDTNFLPSDFIHEESKFIASNFRKELGGPTREIQIAPTDLFCLVWKSDLLLSEFQRDIQRLLTEYLNYKESMSKSDRSKINSWIGFLKAATLYDQKN